MKQLTSGTPRTPGEVSRVPITAGKIGAALRVLRRAAPAWNAPIVSFISIQTRDPFKTLISCILSLRTKDQTTAAAAQRLFERAATPEEMAAIGERELERLIYPVGFYRTKARVIRGICRDLLEHHGGVVPDEIDALLKLKGVGRKTANLVVTQAYGKPGICVDTHVHRISNRWGLVATRTPDKTEIELRRVLPRRHWLGYNAILVAFGQTICHPISPRCSACPIARACPRIGVRHSR
ncbi:MAG TPA: endonuclease III [Candidatus Binataceae bacterium]|nr:endonuclease III [Candidatus Binataceae bacterium]